MRHVREVMGHEGNGVVLDGGMKETGRIACREIQEMCDIFSMCILAPLTLELHFAVR